MTEFLIIIHFGFKGHGHLLMSFFSGKTSLFVGGSLSAGSRQQAAGSRQQAAGSRQQVGRYPDFEFSFILYAWPEDFTKQCGETVDMTVLPGVLGSRILRRTA
jgi:hypothetical protein